MWARTDKYKTLCYSVIITSVNYTRKIPWLAKFRNSLNSKLCIFFLFKEKQSVSVKVQWCGEGLERRP